MLAPAKFFYKGYSPMASLMNVRELRGTMENPQTPLSFPAEWLLDIFNGGRTDSGIRVSELTALNASTVLACVGIICKAIASLPLHVYSVEHKEGRRAKQLAPNHDLYKLLHRFPNKEMTSFTLRAVIQLHLLLWGNGYIEIQRNQGGDVIGLWPRNPARTRPVRTTKPEIVQGEQVPAFTLIFQTTENFTDQVKNDLDLNQTDMSTSDGRYRYILAKNMLHMPGLSLDGRLGQNTVQLCRQTIGLALASEKYAAKFFGNGAVPIGLFEIPEEMEPKAQEELRRQWVEAYGGENSNKTAVLSGGTKFTKIANNPEESQLNELRNFQISEIAAIFGVPQHMLPHANGGNPSGSARNLEQQGTDFLNYCLGPWIDTWEQEIDRKLLCATRGRHYEAVFETRELMFPDAASRQTFYNAGLQWGFLCVNDVRELENLNPISDDWAEKFYITTQVMPRTSGPLPSPVQQKPNARAYKHVFHDALIRATNRRKPDLESYARIFEPILESMLLASGKETRGLSTNPQVQGVIAGLFQRWGQHRGTVTEAAAIDEANRAGSAL